MPGPLDGIRVLDLSRFIAGPFCAQMLGDMGADVIKVERPSGEDARHHAPFYKGESVYTMVFNRNKRGVTLSTRHPRAQRLLEGLVKSSDVLVENFRPGTLEAMGFGYERLRELNPRLVITSISGFGQTGPLAERALFDAIAQATSGLMSMTGAAGNPTLTGTYVADYIAGLHGVIGTLLALQHRERTGEGQVVDVGSLDALFSCLGTAPSAQAMLGEIPTRTASSRDVLTGPANVFAARDGHIYLHAGTNPLFPRLCEVMGRPELAADERFRDVPSRMANIDAIEAEVSAWLAERTVEEAGEELTRVGIPWGRVATIEEVVASPQIAAREMLVEVEHPTLGPLTVPGIPVKLSDSPGTVRKAPPLVGEDTDEVYRELLGLDDAELARLREDGAI
ncbi:CaiB/BaiF CoA transferase family protein [Conexibacter arvalis]|uniref:Crotonobetainyl-CoA:carnitine CoA-transferase CaiB-like acyl-CoA transferase n=1 Tax=Conexibacter arvalis TaxID=912552 RepID=A0A840IIT4_9ACTN|nr:CoA transferase [Conexibacter arvalis]MBB4663848.1 crotonobetainyl-CoA:carnitine CoA-transferase CaiB-like acyl-CoA transferase [Conexibacter arvalis]